MVNELTDFKNPLFFGKSYKIVENEDKSKEIKDENKLEENKSIFAGNNSSIGYTVATAESESQIPQYASMGNIFGKKKKKPKKREVKRKFPDKEKREKELDLMSNVLNNIGDSLSQENMDLYFNYLITIVLLGLMD